MPEAADTRDSDPFARPRLGFLEALVGGDAGAEDRRHLRKVDARRKPRRKGRGSDNVLRATTLAVVTGVVLALAYGFPAGLAIFAAHAGVVQPRNADGVARLEISYARAERSHDAGNLVARNERKRGLHRPVAFRGVQVCMAHAAGHHLDQDLSRTRHGHGP